MLMDWEFLAPLREDWEPVSKPVRIGWLAFYAIFLLYALTDRSGYLLIDYVFVPIHEGGHLLFSYFGHTLMVAGGTLLQLGVPLMLAIYFAFQRQATGVAFCSFFFFENFLNVATYMADSRRMELQYVTVGDPDFAEHDWADHVLANGRAGIRHQNRRRGPRHRLVGNDRGGGVALVEN